VTGTIALLWSLWPKASPTAVMLAVTQGHQGRRSTVVPPLLDASIAYQILRGEYGQEARS
jgi:hypothetical protein